MLKGVVVVVDRVVVRGERGLVDDDVGDDGDLDNGPRGDGRGAIFGDDDGFAYH